MICVTDEEGIRCGAHIKVEKPASGVVSFVKDMSPCLDDISAMASIEHP